MRRLIVCTILFLSFSYGEEIVIALKGVEGGDIKELLLKGEDIVIVVTRDERFNDRAFRKLLGISYEDYKLYRFQLAIEGIGTPPKEIPVKELAEVVRSYNRVIVIAPKRILHKLKKLGKVRVRVERW